MTAIGGFSSNGTLMFHEMGETVSKLSQGRFAVVDPSEDMFGSKSNKLNKLQEYINKGYFLVISVNYGGHYVAVDRIENGKLYIFDPGYYINELEEKYSWDGVDNVKIFKISQ